MAVYMNGELVLYGFVGDSFWSEGFTSTEVLQALAEHGNAEDLSVRLNSGGGYAFEGPAIYNALHAHKGKVTIYVDAIAASAASIIAMAGDEIVMRAGAEMMIHDPSGFTFGTADDHAKAQAALDKLGDQMASIYAARSGNAIADVRQVMRDETWFTAEEAVAAGYADTAEKAKAKPVAAYDYRVYAKAPERLVALATQKGWSLQTETNRVAAAAAPTSREEQTMAETKTADDLAAESAKAKAEGAAAARARIKSIMALDEATGREALASYIAFDTDMDVEAAKAMLSAAAKETATSPEVVDDDSPNPQAYEANRLQASGQAQPTPPQRKRSADLNTSDIYAARRAATRGA